MRTSATAPVRASTTGSSCSSALSGGTTSSQTTNAALQAMGGRLAVPVSAGHPQPRSGEHLAHDPARDVREPEMASLVGPRQPLVIDPQQM